MWALWPSVFIEGTKNSQIVYGGGGKSDRQFWTIGDFLIKCAVVSPLFGAGHQAPLRRMHDHNLELVCDIDADRLTQVREKTSA